MSKESSGTKSINLIFESVHPSYSKSFKKSKKIEMLDAEISMFKFFGNNSFKCKFTYPTKDGRFYIFENIQNDMMVSLQNLEEDNITYQTA